MADGTPSEEQRLYKAFQQVADILIPLKKDARERVYATVGTFFRFAGANAGADVASAPVQPPAARQTTAKKAAAKKAAAKRTAAKPPQARPVQEASGAAPTPKGFLSEKKPVSDVERVATLAFYLTHHRGTKQFKSVNISELNDEAGQRKFANAAKSVSNAAQAGYLAPAKRGFKQLAPAGKRYVDDLPDRAAAKAGFRARKTRKGK